MIKNNTVTLPWQPWFAHIVPKSSPAGRAVLKLQQGRNPYTFMAPRSPPSRFAGPTQRIVTSAGLLTVQPPVSTTALNLTTHHGTRQNAEFGVSRKIYEQVSTRQLSFILKIEILSIVIDTGSTSIASRTYDNRLMEMSLSFELTIKV